MCRKCVRVFKTYVTLCSWTSSSSCPVPVSVSPCLWLQRSAQITKSGRKVSQNSYSWKQMSSLYIDKTCIQRNSYRIWTMCLCLVRLTWLKWWRSKNGDANVEFVESHMWHMKTNTQWSCFTFMSVLATLQVLLKRLLYNACNLPPYNEMQVIIEQEVSSSFKGKEKNMCKYYVKAQSKL